MKIKHMEGPEQSFDDDDEGSFIEIALEPKPRWEKAEQVFQFRLSFSNMLPRNSDSGGSFRRKFLMTAESVETVVSTGSEKYSSFSASSSCSSSSSAVLGRSNARRNPRGMVFQTPAHVKPSSDNRRLVEKENKWRKAVQLLVCYSPENSRLCATESPEADTRTRWKFRNVISRELAKLVVKFRTIKEKSKISLTRASNLIVDCTPERLSSNEPFSRRERKRNNKSRLPEVRRSIKGMIESLTVSCPASTKSSPVHRNYCATEEGKMYTRENSIQAAIAHCKMSFDQAAAP